MKRITFVTICLVFLSFGTSLASPRALLVQTDDLWFGTGIQPASALANAGIPFDRIAQDQFMAQDLSGYKLLYLQGQDGESSAYVANIIPNMAKVQSFVDAGGLALIHFADWESDATIPDIGPLGVTRVQNPTDTATMVHPDPLFNGLGPTDLSGWFYTANGYLTGLPPGADMLVTDGTNPLYARYAIGTGEVWITTMAEEWQSANPLFLANEMNLARLYIGIEQPVPEPVSVLLLALGLLGLVGSGRMGRRVKAEP